MNRSWQIKIIVVLTLIMFVGYHLTCFAQEQTLTLDQVVSIALERNPQIAIFRHSKTAARPSHRGARDARPTTAASSQLSFSAL